MFFTILFDRAWEILDQNRRAYIVINTVFYGVMIVLMIFAVFDQPLQIAMLKNGNDSLATGSLALYGKGYDVGTIFKDTVLMNVGNLLGTSFGLISLPSFIIPFLGLLTGAEHAFEWGMLFSPANPAVRPAMIMHWLALVIEGQAYTLAMLGAYVHGREVIWPGTVGLKSHWRGYVEGVRQTGTLYMLIMVVLVVSALYGLIEYAVMSQFLS